MYKPNPDHDIAIVGMACLFPGAADLGAYWHNVVHKVNAIGDPPAEAWDLEALYDPDSTETDRIYCKKGGFIGPLATFNPVKHGIMPNVVDGAEPDQWLALDLARQALQDAGYQDDVPERHRAAVILGRGTYLNRGNTNHFHHGSLVAEMLQIIRQLHPEYKDDDLQLIRQELRRNLAPFNAATAQGLVPNIIAGRIANKFDLMGPSYTVDAACASSLIALDHAVRGLRRREFDLALVGGAHVVSHAPMFMVFCQLNALSRKGVIRPFDAEADGTILGEGLGMVVIKRLSDALRDGHRVYAVIKGVGTASDGHGLSVMAPRLEGQVLAIRRAYEQTDVSPRSLALVEAHGTGTAVGDATEIQSLTTVFGRREGGRATIAISAVKSMIGHLMPAAGIAGLIKTTLALYHKVLPPTLNVEQPDPALKLEETPFYINTESRPWVHSHSDTPRRAGVNAFGFGGINAHVILEEYDPGDGAAAWTPTSHLRQWDSEVIVLTAATRPALIERARQVAAFCQPSTFNLQPSTPTLKDLAYTLNVAQPWAAERLAVVASDLADLGRKMERAGRLLQEPDKKKIYDAQGGLYYFEEKLGQTGRLAFVFPGEGSQYLRMLADLCLHFPEALASFDQIDRIYARHGRSFLASDVIFPQATFTPEEKKAAETRLWQMEGAVEAILTANGALLAILRQLRIEPDAYLGHSTGEYSALAASGMIDLSQEERLAAFALELNKIHHSLAGEDGVPAVTLLACAAGQDTLQELVAQVDGPVYVGMDNCPHQCVLIGRPEVMNQLVPLLNQRGVITERLTFDRPYHTPLFGEFRRRLQPFVERWLTHSPATPVYSCTTAGPFPNDLDAARQVALDHWVEPVRFQQTIRQMYEDGVRLFVEVGPRGNLSAFIGDVLRKKPHQAIPANVVHRSGVTQLNHLVGLLAAHGAPVDLSYLYARRAPQVVDLHETPRPETGRLKLSTNPRALTLSEPAAQELRNRTAARTALPAPAASTNGHNSDFGFSILDFGQAPPIQNPKSKIQNPVDPVMSAYFQTMEQFLTTQNEVMQAFLGGRSVGSEPLSINSEQFSESSGPYAVGSELPPVNGHQPSPITPHAIRTTQPATTSHQQPVTNDPLPAPDDLLPILLRIVSERTGYPVEALTADLDLEAELGIDSIKRVEILGAFQKQYSHLAPPDKMDALSNQKTLRQMVNLMTPNGSNNGLAVQLQNPKSKIQNPSYPFLRQITRHVPGETVEAICGLSLAEDLFLLDHTMGRDVSLADPELPGLPVMPMTGLMEMMAEAAAVLAPGLKLIGMRNVSVHRWLIVDRDTVTVRLAAQRPPAAPTVQVSLYEDDGQVALAEATLHFGEDYPAAPPTPRRTFRREAPGRWTGEQLYTHTAMFHGPRFQGVARMERVGEDGAAAVLRVLPHDRLLASTPKPHFVIDPVLYDQVGQVVGFWGLQMLPPGTVMAPYHLHELHIYGPGVEAPAEVACQAQVEPLGAGRLRSNLDVFYPDGRLWMRWRAWEDQTFEMPPAFFDLAFAHRRDAEDAENIKGRTLRSLRLGGEKMPARLVTDADFPPTLFTAFSGIWREVLAHAVLGRRERQQWRGLQTPPSRRMAWLLARLAVKELLCDHLQRELDLTLRLADVEILPDEHGRPIANGAWADGRFTLPAVSLAHTDGAAVAAIHPTAPAIGVDLERRRPFPADATPVAFTPDEVEFIQKQGNDDEWLWRGWCAKEAVAKALGRGLVGGPRALVIRSVAAETGEVEVGLTAELAAQLELAAGTTLVAHTTADDEFVAAACP
ncbi:MAG: beta-ketoacyl synthase N-terminal-like domain-containing protein, partial [Chloroflexota bacterium]